MKVFELNQGYAVACASKLDGLETADKYKVIKAVRALKKVADDFNGFVEQTKESEKTEKEQIKIIDAEASREIEIPAFDKIKPEAFEKMMSANSWNAVQAMYMQDLLVQ